MGSVLFVTLERVICAFVGTSGSQHDLGKEKLLLVSTLAPRCGCGRCGHWVDWVSQGLAQVDLSFRLPASFLSVVNSEKGILTSHLSIPGQPAGLIAPT